jgi:YrbI family 3-deoxy-D-manno-octulosonate 8-phosphate phosphatase
MNVAFVPVRCNSKSITFKNIKPFCGKPLVYWTLIALQNSQIIDKIYVAIDCNEIKSIVKSFNFSKVEIFNRSTENADDTASTESVMLEFIDSTNHLDKDLFFLVQATSPFTQSIDFDNALKELINRNADSLVTCVRSKRFFWTKNNKPLNYNFNKRPRRQEFEGIMMENGAFYINSIKNIKTHKNRLSGEIAIYEMEEFTGIELDEEDDWFMAENLMNKYILKKMNTPKIKLFFSDVDGTLTDAGMYYSENGDELKKFNTHDGKGFELLRNAGIKTGLITSEITDIVEHRAKKLKVDYLFQGASNNCKLEIIKDVCFKEGVSLNEVAYIGDDINCKEILQKVGIAACPANAVNDIKNLTNILILSKNGGEGAVREFIESILRNN